MRLVGIHFATAFALGTVSCNTLIPASFFPFENVSRIEVRGGAETRVIDDPVEIQIVARFVNARTTFSVWTVPIYGVPAPFLTADFYGPAGYMGHFGVGTDFFETQQHGSFFSCPARNDERTEFMKLLGVPNESIRELEAKHGTASR